MTHVYKLRSVQEVANTVETLQKAAEGLTKIAESMRNAGLEEALLPWSQATFKALDSIRDLPKYCDIALEKQIAAKNEGRPSQVHQAVEKSKKDVARRVAKKPPARPKRAK